MMRAVPASAEPRGRSASTTTRGTCGRSAKYRFGTARTKKMRRNAMNAQNPAV